MTKFDSLHTTSAQSLVRRILRMCTPRVYLAVLLAIPLLGQTALNQRELDIVLKTQYDGIPWSECEHLGVESIPYLIKALKGPMRFAGNSVVCLGVLGDPKAIKPLEEFLETGYGVLSVPQYLSRTSVLWALGAIVNRSGDESGLEYLIKGLDQSVWNQRVRWSTPYNDTADDRNLQLARASMQGLGLAASPKALRAIQDYKCEKAPCPLDDVRGDALQTCHAINEIAKKHSHKGSPLRAYYQQNP